MLEWFVFDVFFPLLPAPAIWLVSRLLNEERQRRFFQVIKDGQLCFYCFLTFTVLLRDLEASHKASMLLMCSLGFVGFLVGLVYAAAVLLDDAVNEKKFGWASIFAVLATISVSLGVRFSEGLL